MDLSILFLRWKFPRTVYTLAYTKSQIMTQATQATALKALHNGIMNDYSIRRYTLGWETVVAAIKRRYKTIPENPDIQFETRLLIEAAEVASGRLKSDIEAFGRELNLNLQTLREKRSSTISRG